MDKIVSFEATCKEYEKFLNMVVYEILNENIFKLRGTTWQYDKKHINVYPVESNGKKKRGAHGLGHHLDIVLNRTSANTIWKYFKDISIKTGFNKIERLRNNEQELGMYDFRATNEKTGDKFSCDIYLLEVWRKPSISISMFIAPRYREVDL